MTKREPILVRHPDFKASIEAGEDEALSQKLRRAETIGRPLGSDTFLARLERKTGRALKAGKRGPRPKVDAGEG